MKNIEFNFMTETSPLVRRANASAAMCRIIVYLWLASCSALFGETFHSYNGHVNGNEAVLKVCWLGDTVVGTLSTDGKVFAVAGDNSRQGEMFVALTFEGRTVAYAKLHRSTSGNEVLWKGSMRIEASETIVPMLFKRLAGSIGTQPN